MFKAFAIVLLPFVAFCGFMYLKQPDMVFFPIKDLHDAPGNWGMSYENVNLVTHDGEANLHGWYIPAQNATRTVLFFHGNAGNISQRGESLKIFYSLGVNVFIIDYRGYGSSTGKPSEQGIYDDARSAWDYLVDERKIAPDTIIIFGRSLGGIVATQLASEVSAAGLVVESSFSSARDVARHLMPYLSYLVVLRFSLNAEDTIRKVKLPVLVMHSPADDMIPFQMGKKIFDAANEPKTFQELRGNHNSGFVESQPEYQKVLLQFIQSTETRAKG